MYFSLFFNNGRFTPYTWLQLHVILRRCSKFFWCWFHAVDVFAPCRLYQLAHSTGMFWRGVASDAGSIEDLVKKLCRHDPSQRLPMKKLSCSCQFVKQLASIWWAWWVCLCLRTGGVSNIKDHAWYKAQPLCGKSLCNLFSNLGLNWLKDFDWDEFEMLKMEPPYKPAVPQWFANCVEIASFSNFCSLGQFPKYELSWY